MRRVLAVLAAAAMATGCVYDVWSWDRCATDPESCSFSDSGWHTVANCQRSDPLQVELGQGEDDFVPFTAGEVPVMHGGSGSQGGSVFHVWGGARIANPDPAHRRFRLEFHSHSTESYYGYPYFGPDVEAFADASSGVTPTSGPAAAGTERDYQRIAVVGASMKTEANGAMSRAGFVLFVSSPPSRLTLDVVDECGRTGSAVFKPGSGKSAP
jgi:hypothetical protein